MVSYTCLGGYVYNAWKQLPIIYYIYQILLIESMIYLIRYRWENYVVTPIIWVSWMVKPSSVWASMSISMIRSESCCLIAVCAHSEYCFRINMQKLGAHQVTLPQWGLSADWLPQDARSFVPSLVWICINKSSPVGWYIFSILPSVMVLDSSMAIADVMMPSNANSYSFLASNNQPDADTMLNGISRKVRISSYVDFAREIWWWFHMQGAWGL